MGREEVAVEWNRYLVGQLGWHWQTQLRPRLDGLTDEEYRWEPAPGAWSLRPRDRATSAMAEGEVDWVIDFAWPEPVPTPVPTIAWRLGHILVGVFRARTANHFGGPPASYDSTRWPTTAADALAQLDQAHDAWTAGVRGLGEEGLARPCGPSEGPFADLPLGALVLHINREVIHHGAEIALLRDLYAVTPMTP